MDQSVEEHLPAYRVRPRFETESDSAMADITNKFKVELAKEGASCEGKVNPSFVTLLIPHGDRHYWSPQLSINLEEQENGSTLLRGIYGPRPSIWTMFVFFYSVIGLAILVVSTLGLSYYTLEKPTTIFWWIPVLIVILLTLYLVSYFGQKVGHKQMITLHQFFEETTGISTENN